MKTKQQVIADAYIKLIGEYKFKKWQNLISEDDGTIRVSNKTILPNNGKDFKVIAVYKHESLIIPIELIGIENNNGWTVINSEADLPAKEFYKGYHTFPTDFKCNSYGLHKYFKSKEITHYQPIVKPLPPLHS